jgi:hypothetical protein
VGFNVGSGMECSEFVDIAGLKLSLIRPYQLFRHFVTVEFVLIFVIPFRKMTYWN